MLGYIEQLMNYLQVIGVNVSTWMLFTIYQLVQLINGQSQIGDCCWCRMPLMQQNNGATGKLVTVWYNVTGTIIWEGLECGSNTRQAKESTNTNVLQDPII